MNPANWLLRSAARHPDAPALFTGADCVADYSTFAARAAGFAAGLAARGIGPGDRVALFCANRTEYLEALFGIWWRGAVAVPINAKLHPTEAAWIIADAGARLVLVDAATGLSPQATLGLETDCLSLHGAEYRALRDSRSDGPPAPMAPDDLAWLFYTSGTTGRPKGVMITTGNIASMALSYFADVDEVHPQDTALYAAPMSHGAGLYSFMHVMRGARHAVPASGGFDAGEILDLAPQIGPVSMFAAPTMVRRLVAAARARPDPGAGLRSVIYAGGPMYEADILEAVDVMGPRFIQIYGQGECPMGITALPRKDVAERDDPRWRDRLNSVGRAQSEVEVAILDETGAPLAPGEIGEIAVRGRTVMQGYWQNPDATADTLRDGWLWTGDVGRMDAEGYVTLQDRSKDVIISGGTNVYPREIEEALLTHPDIAEIAVVGQRDAEWGEVVVAFVVPEPGHKADPAKLDAFCMARIARFKRPKRYEFLDALPKNNYGKVLKTALRERL